MPTSRYRSVPIAVAAAMMLSSGYVPAAAWQDALLVDTGDDASRAGPRGKLALGASTEWITPQDWTQLPPIPDRVGFGGPLVGTHNGQLIVAGGANFPQAPPWPVGDRPPGEKVWHDRIFTLAPGESQWRPAGKLSAPRAYAAVVSHASGMYVLGGESYGPERKHHDVAGVVRLSWNKAQNRVDVQDDALPRLPQPLSYHSAAITGDVIYVAASYADAPQSRRLDAKALWTIDLSMPSAKRKWKALPSWPGEPRYKMSLVVAPIASDDRTAREGLYLISGGNWAKDAAGQFDLAKFEFYDDAYRFDPATNIWTPIADLPKLIEKRSIDTTGYVYDRRASTWKLSREGEDEDEDETAADVHALFDEQSRPAAAAVAAYDGAGQILLFSGSTGRYDTMNVKDRPPFPREILAYDIGADRWTTAGRMPVAVVTSGAAWWQGQIVIASGEVRPGVRTRKVQSLRIGERLR